MVCGKFEELAIGSERARLYASGTGDTISSVVVFHTRGGA